MNWKHELFYKPYQDTKGKRRYKRNSRKLWATLSWLLLSFWFVIIIIPLTLYAVMLDFQSLDGYPWGFLGTITGLLFTNAQAAIGWYTWSKKIDNGSDGEADYDPTDTD